MIDLDVDVKPIDSGNRGRKNRKVISQYLENKFHMVRTYLQGLCFLLEKSWNWKLVFKGACRKNRQNSWKTWIWWNWLFSFDFEIWLFLKSFTGNAHNIQKNMFKNCPLQIAFLWLKGTYEVLEFCSMNVTWALILL